MRGIIKKLDPICLPSHIVVHNVSFKRVESAEVQTDKITLVNSQTMTDPNVYHSNRDIQCNLNLIPVKKRIKSIQCNIQSKINNNSDSESSKGEDSEEDLIFAPPVKRDYSSKCKQIDENTFECTVCGLTKTIKHVLLRHIPAHDEKSTLCQFCGKLCSDTKLGLTSHEVYCRKRTDFSRSPRRTPRGRARAGPSTAHLERVCPHCKRVSKSYITHRDHVNTHTKERPNVCSCGARFRSVYNLYVHRDQFGCAAKGCFSPYVDDIEDENSGKRRQLNLQAMQERIKEGKQDPPKQRPKVVTSRRPRQNQQTGYRKPVVPKPFKGECDICGRGFTNKECFVRHKKLHQERRFVCQECNSAYQTAPQLNTHIKLSHLNRVKCELCKNLVPSSRYDSHLRRHKGDHSVECNLCDAKFFSKPGLRMHIKSIHENVKQKTRPEDFVCYLCGPEIKSKPKRHLTGKRHLDMEKAWKKEHKIDQFPCIRCFDMHFDTYIELSKHTHSVHHWFIYSRMAQVLEGILEEAKKYWDKPEEGHGDKKEDEETNNISGNIDDKDSSSNSDIIGEDLGQDFMNICANPIETEELDIKDFNLTEMVKMMEEGQTADLENLSVNEDTS